MERLLRIKPPSFGSRWSNVVPFEATFEDITHRERKNPDGPSGGDVKEEKILQHTPKSELSRHGWAHDNHVGAARWGANTLNEQQVFRSSSDPLKSQPERDDECDLKVNGPHFRPSPLTVQFYDGHNRRRSMTASNVAGKELIYERVAQRLRRAATEQFTKTDTIGTMRSCDLIDNKREDAFFERFYTAIMEDRCDDQLRSVNSIREGPSEEQTADGQNDAASIAPSADMYIHDPPIVSNSSSQDETQEKELADESQEEYLADGTQEEDESQEEYLADGTQEDLADLTQEYLVDGTQEDLADGTKGSNSNHIAATATSFEPYTQSQIDAEVFVRVAEGKGRCLYTSCERRPGDVIFVEEPVLTAIPSLSPELWTQLEKINEESELSLPPIWHFAAICSLTLLPKEQRNIITQKWVPDPDKSPSADVLRVLKRIRVTVDAQQYERFLNAWRFNSFGHHTETQGLVLYNNVSMMAHSCANSACWHYGKDSAFVLRARQHMTAGDEITISYIGDEDLVKATHVRRERLSAWLFRCDCLRCDAKTDKCRGFCCYMCRVGTIYLKTEDDLSSLNSAGEVQYTLTAATACDVCRYELPCESINEYVKSETQYVEAIESGTPEDLQSCYDGARSIFKCHWILYSLDNMLCEAYKNEGYLDEAKYHTIRRVAYWQRVSPQASFTLAWLHEELGDIVATIVSDKFHNEEVDCEIDMTDNQRREIHDAYDSASSLLGIMCGPTHNYTTNATVKLQRLQKLADVANELRFNGVL